MYRSNERVLRKERVMYLVQYKHESGGWISPSPISGAEYNTFNGAVKAWYGCFLSENVGEFDFYRIIERTITNGLIMERVVCLLPLEEKYDGIYDTLKGALSRDKIGKWQKVDRIVRRIEGLPDEVVHKFKGVDTVVCDIYPPPIAVGDIVRITDMECCGAGEEDDYNRWRVIKVKNNDCINIKNIRVEWYEQSVCMKCIKKVSSKEPEYIPTPEEIANVRAGVAQWEWHAEHPGKSKGDYFEERGIITIPIHGCYFCQSWNTRQRHNEGKTCFEVQSYCPLDTKELHCDGSNRGGTNSPYSNWKKATDPETRKIEGLRIVRAGKDWLKIYVSDSECEDQYK